MTFMVKIKILLTNKKERWQWFYMKVSKLQKFSECGDRHFKWFDFQKEVVELF